MQRALELGKQAYNRGEVPVGAVIVDYNGNIIAEAHNLCEAEDNPLLHAEYVAISEAINKSEKRFLSDCDIYVTLEPCPMCASMLSLVRIRRLYFGAYDTKTGGVEHGPMIFNSSSVHHKPEIFGGIMEDEARKYMEKFFQNLRK